jgi:hypothetical protein
MRMEIVLVHSPFVGPSTWRSVATELRNLGAELAESLGWPVTTLTGGHIDTVNNPAQIAEQIFKLTQRT